MYLAEGLQQKWAPVLDHEDMPKIKDSYRKAVTAVLLENQEKAMAEEHGMGNFGFQQLHEAPAGFCAITCTVDFSLHHLGQQLTQMIDDKFTVVGSAKQASQQCTQANVLPHFSVHAPQQRQDSRNQEKSDRQPVHHEPDPQTSPPTQDMFAAP